MLLLAAAWLATAPWVVAVIALVALACGVLWIERGIRRPIAEIARALRAAAAGEAAAPPRVSTPELSELWSAFDATRRGGRAREQRLESIVDDLPDGIVIFDAHGVIERFNKAAERLFGYAEAELVGKDVGELIAAATGITREDHQRYFLQTEIKRLIGREGEITGRRKDGGTFATAFKISSTMIDGRQLYTALVADISERKAMVNQLKAMAEHDGLTGLYNRAYFQQELERVIERARRTKDAVYALLYIDLDNFKYVNDTLGHAAGDRLLIEVAGILHKRARKSDLIARFGGDEFTVLLYDITPELAQLAAESFRKKLANYSFRHDGEQVDIGCSIGVAAIGPDIETAEEMLSRADLACHVAKRNGRNQVHVFKPTDVENVSPDMGWSHRITHALEHGRFSLACQPIFNARNRGVEAYEVLIRMIDETGQLVMPSGFLSSAERFGLSTEIDMWVIENAAGILKQQRRSLPMLRYSINLSGQTIANPAICDLIQQKLAATGLEANALTFEVTETAAIADMALAQLFLTRLRQMGCGTALDQFGSGMSSFVYLKDLPVDSVKFDGRFVKNLAANPVDQAMVKAMNDIAHALGKHTIAGRVEDEESFRLLVEYGVDYAQGFHLGRPDVASRLQPRGGERNSRIEVF